METTNEDQQKNTSSNEETCKTIKLTIRTAACQKTIDVDEEIAITDLRSKVSELFELENKTQAVLIFGGKILKDHENILGVGIKDGQTVHLVIRRNPSGDSNASTNRAQANLSSQNSTNTTTNSSDNNNSPLPGLGAGNPMLGNLSEIQQRLQQMFINDPQATQNMVNMLHPTMQQIMTNPDMLRSLFGGMQRMQSIIESNPEVNRLLSNPELLRESLEMVRNPAALQEVMRNYDRALNNVESMPGGFNALRRMYTDIQEPLMNAFQDTNQFTSPTSNSDESNSDSVPRTENRDPLPNPWASPAATQTSFPPGFAAAAAAAAAGLSAANATGGGTGFTGSGQDQSAGNLAGGNISQQADSFRQNQELMQLMTNPEFTQIIEQITSGFERLQRLAPNLFGRLGLPNIPGMPAFGAAANNGASAGSIPAGANFDLNSMLRMSREILERAPDATQNQQATGGANQQADAARMLAQLMNQAGGLGNADALSGGGATPTDASQPPPEVRYSQQLQQLSEMGFTNREANIRALIATLGDINQAIARLLPQ